MNKRREVKILSALFLKNSEFFCLQPVERD